jgi:transcriptional regulator with XRE-family HTH domain
LRPLEGVRELRERRMLSQQELADRAGVSLFTIQRIERGEGSVRPKTGRAVAAALGVRVEDLLLKAQAPLPFEEEPDQRCSSFLEAWESYMHRRARAWEQALEEEGGALLGEPQFIFDTVYRNEQVQTEASELLTTVGEALLAGTPDVEVSAELPETRRQIRRELLRAQEELSAARRAGLGRAYFAVIDAAAR